MLSTYALKKNTSHKPIPLSLRPLSYVMSVLPLSLILWWMILSLSIRRSSVNWTVSAAMMSKPCRKTGLRVRGHRCNADHYNWVPAPGWTKIQQNMLNEIQQNMLNVTYNTHIGLQITVLTRILDDPDYKTTPLFQNVPFGKGFLKTKSCVLLRFFFS